MTPVGCKGAPAHGGRGRLVLDVRARANAGAHARTHAHRAFDDFRKEFNTLYICRMFPKEWYAATL